MVSEPGDAEATTLEAALELNEFGQNGDNSLNRMAHACLTASVAKSTLLRAKENLSIIIIDVPAEDWLVPIGMAARAIWKGSSVRTCGTRTATRTNDIPDLLPRHLSGHGLVLVSDAADLAVPEVLLDAATERFRILRPSKGLFLKVARTLLKGDVKSAFGKLEIDRVNFTALCACLVKGDTADNAANKLARVVDRLSVQPVDDNVPSLAQVHGFGQSAAWAHALNRMSSSLGPVASSGIK